MSTQNWSNQPITPFGFYCQHVLPLVYDESLSYYETLCKLQAKLNEVIKTQNDLQDAFQNLLEWVNTQIETYTKEQLQEWLDDGTLENIILQALGLLTKVKVVNELPTPLENDYLYLVRGNDTYQYVMDKKSVYDITTDLAQYRSKRTNELIMATFNWLNVALRYRQNPIATIKEINNVSLLFAQNMFDFVTLQEQQQFYDFLMQYRFLEQFYPYVYYNTTQYVIQYQYGIATISSETPSIDVSTFTVGGAVNSTVQKTQYQYGLDRISVYNVHFNYGGAFTNIDAQMTGLAGIIDSDTNKYKFIQGDFNATPEECVTGFNAFVSRGFKIMNPNRSTVIDPNDAQRAIDNIIVSANIDKVEDNVINTGYSDHYLYWCKVKLN